jgi:transcriptional regulator with XRE-family HTH domain
MQGSIVTAEILENIESGRKADPSISQLLNIARALAIPPSYLLAPLGRPDSPLDLPNLSDAFAGVTAAEFDSWFAAIPTGAYRSATAAERTDIDQLNALRELHGRRREATRLRAVLQIQDESGDSDLTATRALTEERLTDVVSDVRRLEQFLESAGYLPETF